MRILVVDDEPNMTQVLAIALGQEGYRVDTFNNAVEALAFMREAPPDLVITDLKMPGMDGLTFIGEIKKIDEPVPVVMMTAFSTVQTAVEAMKAGAYDYIIKPFEPDELKLVIRKALENRRLLLENRELRTRAECKYVGASRATLEMLDLVAQVAGTKATVLVRGESGTGKELVAQLIHAESPRKGGPFVKVNCAAIPENLLESELFGHVKGAFTGAVKDKTGKFHLADGGTIFLDEIGDLPLPLQGKLLRVLQERQFEKVGGTQTISVDVRIVAATNRDLEAAIKLGEYREDLFYRLNVFPVTITPLRERKEDIPALVDHFVEKFAADLGREVRSVTGEFRAALIDYGWPGNARELSNFIERATILARDGRFDRALFERLSPAKSASPRGESRKLEDIERDHVLAMLAETGGNRAKAADALGIDRTTLYRMLKRYGIAEGEPSR